MYAGRTAGPRTTSRFDLAPKPERRSPRGKRLASALGRLAHFLRTSVGLSHVSATKTRTPEPPAVSTLTNDMMFSDYNARKAAQVIAFFAMRCAGRSMHVVKAAKLVYLADRESIKEFGFPILDESRVSMKHGPVNSTTYAHINGEYDLAACGWSDFVRDRADHQISANTSVGEDDLDELSDADIDCLNTVWKRFGHMTEWELRDWTHDRRNVPEWENPGNTSIPIPLERIMTAVGIENSDEQAEVIRDHQRIARVFGSLKR